MNSSTKNTLNNTYYIYTKAVKSINHTENLSVYNQGYSSYLLQLSW